jgi:sulfur-carrier protein adenylyltransferase/sulfurtransferase
MADDKEKLEREISIDEARRLLTSENAPVLIDVREEWETTRGILDGSVHIPLDKLDQSKGLLPGDPGKPVIVYCAIGMRSTRAVRKLVEMGYMNVSSMTGGISAWIQAGYPVVNEAGFFSQEEYERYSRHIILKGMGEEGQRRLSRAKMLVVGAGGLGCPALLYLAACGVGTIGIADFDRVEMSNLNRQVLHFTENVGKQKTESAEETIQKINPHIKTVLFNERVDAGNVYRIIEGFDIVIDGTDNINTKFLLNDACYFVGKPYIFGGAVAFDGQSGVFDPASGGPCLRCMFPEPPPEHLVPT